MPFTIEADFSFMERFHRNFQALPAEIPGVVRKRGNQVAQDVRTGVKIRTPKDSTRATNTWGIEPTPTVNYVTRVGTINASKPDDGIWQYKESPTEMTWTQGSRVPYFPELNAGTSRQAPAGFVDAEALRGEELLHSHLEKDIEELLFRP